MYKTMISQKHTVRKWIMLSLFCMGSYHIVMFCQENKLLLIFVNIIKIEENLIAEVKEMLKHETKNSKATQKSLTAKARNTRSWKYWEKLNSRGQLRETFTEEMKPTLDTTPTHTSCFFLLIL